MVFFNQNGKKTNIVPIYEQFVKNYRPVSPLPPCSKFFERLIYDNMFSYLSENNLISENQPGFKSGYFCVNQHLAITHEIYSSFDKNYEVRAVFLDISQAFDKLWYEGIIYKLKHNGISVNLLKLQTIFLKNRKQSVVVNGQCLSLPNVNAKLRQGSISGPLLFLI